MITVGVAGELFVEFMASSKQTALRKVNAEISDAFKNATERDHLAVLKAETLANESRTVAEREQIARLRLEERVAPRRLTPEVRAKLIAAVKGHASAAPIEINSSMSDAESGEFSAMLRDALKDAGWKFSGGSLVAWDSPAPRAVTVAINPADVNSSAITNAAVALQRALYSIGFAIDPQAKSDRNAGVGIIRLIVGFKPEK